MCFAVPLRVYYARMRILRILCAEAHNAHMRMCAAAHYAHRRILRRCVDAHIMRICANYAYMRILCVDAQMMRICAEYAYMRILRVYAPYGRGRKTLRIPRENGPGGRGLCNWENQPPPSPVSLFTVFQSHRKHLHISTHKLGTPARGGGGLPLPAEAAAAP